MSKLIDDLNADRQEQFREITKLLARRVRGWRKKTGLGGRAFAQRAGIDHATLVAIESGTANVSLLVVFLVAKAARIDFKAFFENLLPEAPAEVRDNDSENRGESSPEEDQFGPKT
jgi:transcriptional regulator with XRE-family HTH domain